MSEVVKDRVHMMTLRCSNKECMLRARVGRILNKPALQVGAFRFCPLCGGLALTMTDVDETYWEVIAEKYEMPVNLIQMLYNNWNPHEHYRFSDYVAELKREAETVEV